MCRPSPLLVLSLLALLTSGCPRPDGAGQTRRTDREEVVRETDVPHSPTRGLPPGQTCSGRDDCPSDQVCVDRVCVYSTSSVAGEILATAARALEAAGDVEGAVRTYGEALSKFRGAHAPIPPEVLCGAASTMLRAANDETREQAARVADDCFRTSLPHDPYRVAAMQAIGRHRFEGLDLSHFDGADPPAESERLFSVAPSEPTIDAVEIEIGLSDREAPGYSALRDALRDEGATRVIGDCFTQDWNVHHERSAAASLVLKFETQMRDMGDYDVYTPHVEVVKTTLAEDGFEPCLARGLTAALGPGPRVGSSVTAWQEPFSVQIRIR